MSLSLLCSVAVQDLTSLVGHFDKECGHDDRSNLSGPVVRWQLHQSGINAIDVWVQRQFKASHLMNTS